MHQFAGRPADRPLEYIWQVDLRIGICALYACRPADKQAGLLIRLHFSNVQHGFHKKLSCETQLSAVIQDNAYSLGLSQQVDAIILDFIKAFDTATPSSAL